MADGEPTTSEAAKELGRGRKLTLLNGQVVRVVFTLYTLACVEDAYGNLDAIDKALERGSQGPVIRIVGKLLANSIVDEAGEPMPVDENWILRQIDLSDVNKVFGEVREGLSESFQKPQANRAARRAASSLGASSSTSGASPSASAAATSGG